MIRQFHDNASFLEFVRSLRSSAFFDTFRLDRSAFAFDEAEQLCFAAASDGELTGVFAFRRYEDEHILEMSRWLSRSEAACREMLDELKARGASYEAQFTFDPNDRLLKSLLTEYGAEVFPEQQNMELTTAPTCGSTEGVELLSEPYRERYFALHRKSDAYMSGETAAAEPETYRVLLAIDNGDVAGYLDATHCYETNNVADIFVREEDRGKGWGFRLLSKAVELNAPKRMTLQVDVDNVPALRLYEKIGFRKMAGKNFVDAIWKL